MKGIVILLENINYKNFFKKLLILLFFFSITLTNSFQTFKYFDIKDSTDPKIYIKMSKGDYNVSPTHKYRWVVPKTVEIIRPIVSKFNLPIYYDEKQDEISIKNKNDKFLFFLVNLSIISLTAYFTYIFILNLGLGHLNGLIGGVLFLLNRYINLSAAIPMVDSLQYFCIILYSIFLLNNQTIKTSLLMPLMVISKETLIPLIFIPLINNKLKRNFIFLSILLSIFILIFVRQQIYNLNDDVSINLFENLISHFGLSLKRLLKFFTINGFLRFFSGYGIILLFALLGYLENFKRCDFFIPLKINLLVPYSLFLCLFSNDSGRMLTISFPVVISYSLYFINTRLLNIKKINLNSKKV